MAAANTKPAAAEATVSDVVLDPEIAGELGITPEIMAEIKAGEDATKEWLLAQGVEKITVPRGITLSPALVVQYNAVRFSLPIGVEVEAPTPIVAIARERISKVLEAEANARRKSGEA